MKPNGAPSPPPPLSASHGLTGDKAIVARMALSVRAAGVSMQELATALLMQLHAESADGGEDPQDKLANEARDRAVLMRRSPSDEPKG